MSLYFSFIKCVYELMLCGYLSTIYVILFNAWSISEKNIIKLRPPKVSHQLPPLH